MRTESIIAIIAIMLAAIAIALMLLANTCSDKDVLERVVRLEKKVDYVVEVIKNRRSSPEHCDGLSGENLLTCALGPNERCKCIFFSDAQDRENEIFSEAIAQIKEEIRAVGRAKRAAEAARPNQSEEEHREE